MVKKNLEERVEAQKKKVEQERARLQKLQQQAQAEDRKKRTRQLILLGTLVQSLIERQPDMKATLNEHALAGGLSDRDYATIKELVD